MTCGTAACALNNFLLIHLCFHPPSSPVTTNPLFDKLYLMVTYAFCYNFFEQLQKNANKLCCYYNLLEVMLDFLCHHDVDQDLPLEANAFCQVHDAILSASNGIFYLLMQIDSGAMDIVSIS